MTLTADILRDRYGRPLLICPDCRFPLTSSDIFEQGLRMPEPGETREEYCEAELLDELTHMSCLRARRTG
jgi:hypothetical protein